MIPTKLVYLEDFTVLKEDAHVLAITQENNRLTVVLDQTIFYPQGGGQPYDQGIIENATGRFKVDEVRFIDGIVKHIGAFEQGTFKSGDTVTSIVDQERRELNSRLHSAGHVVDRAITALKLNWFPGKGYHFPDGPYIEYTGNLEGLDKEKLKTEIEALCNTYITEGATTTLLFLDKEKMKEVCHHVPNNVPANKPSRVVMFGAYGVPCGGTHVKNLSDIKSMTIRKIKQEGAHIRVGYDVFKENSPN